MSEKCLECERMLNDKAERFIERVAGLSNEIDTSTGQVQNLVEIGLAPFVVD